MRFHSLPTQVAQFLRTEIANGRWVDSLPGERNLATTLRVSRRTVTAALTQLQRDGVVQAEPGRGHRITDKVKRVKADRLRQIGLLAPAMFDAMRPGALLWVNELQAMLADAGFRLNFFHGTKYFSGRPSRALRKLVTSNPQSAWILSLSTEQTQQWFVNENIPTVVSGTCQGNIDLPDVDLDFYAMGRHVAARIAARRHRKAVLFLTHGHQRFKSEAEVERGFREILSQTGCEAITVYHDRTRDSIVRVLRRLFEGRERPTALVVINSMDYITAITYLGRCGIRVPEDVSVVARNDDTFMNALLPEPTRYHANPHRHAGRLFKLVLQIVDGQQPLRAHVRIEPEFIAGASLAQPPDERPQIEST